MLPTRRFTSYIPRIRMVIAVLIGMVILGLSFPVMASELKPGAVGHLSQVGPVSQDNGFPVWYKDETGRRLQICLDKDDIYCGFLTGDIPDDTKPISFPDNFPEEAFYQRADARMDTVNDLRITSNFSLEAAFVNGPPVDGEQVVFGRIRFYVRGLPGEGAYRITHPYGQDILTAVSDGVGGFEIRFTEDIGGLNGTAIGGTKDFRIALNSRISPWLEWDSARPVGYLGDPNFEHTITGSPYVDEYGKPQNYLRVEGPFKSSQGPFTKENLVTTNAQGAPIVMNDPAFPCVDGVTESCIETNLFTVMGKEAVNGGVEADQATYSQTADGDVVIDVFANSVDSQALVVRDGAGGTYFYSTNMREHNGLYYARVKTRNKNAIPPQVKVENISDNPTSSSTLELHDRIIATAEYNSDTSTLTVTADSSDDAAIANFTVVGYGTITGTESNKSSGEMTAAVQAPPTAITVNSAVGGTVTVPVKISGAEFTPIPIDAFAGVDQTIIVGNEVVLDGTGSAGDITGYSWTQTDGTPTVTLNNANEATASFTAPAEPTTLTFQLTVDGPGGPKADTITIKVVQTINLVQANAGADQDVAGGAEVTLDGSGSKGDITGYSWTQKEGTPVTLANANAAVATFTAPQSDVPAALVFELTVTGPGGPQMDTVSINVTPAVAPVSIAGTDQTVASGRTVTLDGAGSTGVIDSFLWTKTSGLDVTLTGADTAAATFTAPTVTEPTPFVFELKVQGPGGSSISTVTITVTPAAPPVAITGADQTATGGKPVILDGAGSTGTIDTYLWEQVGGQPVQLADAATDTATFTAPGLATQTTLVFQLTVTGPLGTDVKQVSVVVDPPAPPVADAGPDQTEIAGHLVTLNGSGSTGYIDSYSWTQTAGPEVALSDPTSAAPTFTAPEGTASFTFALTVKGPGGESSSEVTINVKPAAPVANAGGNQILPAGSTVTLDGSGSTGEITSYLWTQTGGTSVTLSDVSSAAPTFTAPNEDAALTFELTVEGPGGSASNVVTVDVRVAPIANGGADQTAISDSSVTLDASASTGDIRSYAWTQTSGPQVALSNANSATATFTAPNVTTSTTLVFDLTVQGPGGTSNSTVSVIVKPPAVLTANAGTDQTVLEGLDVTLDGSGSSGEIDQYVWTEATGAVDTLYGVKPTFTAPRTTGAEGVTLDFTLTVTGPGGSKISNVKVYVKNFANAGADQQVTQGTTVRLNGSGSVEATSYSWKQLSGPPVSLTGADTANPSFVFPKLPDELVFELTTRGPLGTDTDIVQITTVPDVVDITLAEFRTSKDLWRIEGTSNVFGPNVKIEIYNGGTHLITVDVDPAGDWKWVDTGAVPSGVLEARSSSGGTDTRTVIVRR